MKNQINIMLVTQYLGLMENVELIIKESKTPDVELDWAASLLLNTVNTAKAAELTHMRWFQELNQINDFEDCRTFLKNKISEGT